MTYDDPARSPTNHPDAWGLKPGNNKQPFKVVPPDDAETRGAAAVRSALEPAPHPRTEPQKNSDLSQLAGWLNAISFLDLLELAKSITGSDADPSLPVDVKLAKALATWARSNVDARAA